MMAPVDVFRVRPCGRAPLATANVNGAIPPEVETPELTEPTAILGRDEETIFTVAAGLLPTVPVKVRD